MFIVHRYDINGQHTLLDDDNRPMLFNSEDDAKAFLSEHGLSEEAIEECSIEEATDEDINTEYYSEKGEV